MELEQRLQEDPFHIDRQGRQVKVISTQGSGPGKVLHEFNIDEELDVQAIWHKFHREYAIRKSKPSSKAFSEDAIRQSMKGVSVDLGPEEHRKRHFDSTNPPKITNSPITPADIASDITRDPHNPAATLTIEGRRQAQSAGQKLRTRDTAYSTRAPGVSLADRSTHHHRWASYQSNQSFLGAPSDVQSVLPAQPRNVFKETGALHPKSRPSAHALPSQQSDVSGNDFNEKRLDTILPKTSQLVTEKGSLIDVFEAELAKPSEDLKDKGPGTLMSSLSLAGRSLGSIPSRTNQMNHPEGSIPKIALLSSSSLQEQNTCPVQNHDTKNLMLGEKEDMSTKQQPITSSTTPRQPQGHVRAHCVEDLSRGLSDPSMDIEQSIKTAVAGFESCLRSVVDVLRAADPAVKSRTDLAGSALDLICQFTNKDLQNQSHERQQGPTCDNRNTAENGKERLENFCKKEEPQPNDFARPASYTPHTLGADKASSTEDLKSDSAFPESFRAAPEPSKGNAGRAAQKADSWNAPSWSRDTISPDYPSFHRKAPVARRSPSMGHLDPTDNYGLRRHNSTGAFLNHVRPNRNSFPGKGRSRPLDPSRNARRDRACSPAFATRFPSLGQFERSNFPTEIVQPDLIDLEEVPRHAFDNSPPQQDALNTFKSPPIDRLFATQAEPFGPPISGLQSQEPNSTQESTSLEQGTDEKHPQSKSEVRFGFPSIDDNLAILKSFQSPAKPISSGKAKRSPFHCEANNEGWQRVEEDAGSNVAECGSPKRDIAVLTTNNLRHAKSFHFPARTSPGRILTGATLNRPFDAYDNDPMAQRIKNAAVRRSATVADLRRNVYHAPRRPLTGAHRDEARNLFESAISRGNPLQHTRPRPFSFAADVSKLSPATDQLPHQENHTTRPQENASATAGYMESPRITEHRSKVRSCVDQLVELGFGGMDPERLSMFVETASGNLDEALEMICEEQTAQDRQQSLI